MIKRICAWAKTTDIWIVMAQIYTVFLCFFMMTSLLGGSGKIDKVVGLIAFAILGTLIFRYSLYKKFQTMLLVLFFIITFISGFMYKEPFIRVLGSNVHRKWYMYLLAMAVAYVLKGAKKDRWIYIMFLVQSTLMSVIFLNSIIGATKNLLTPDYVPSRMYGKFISGRLSTFTSANTAGPTAVVLIILSIILIYRSKSLRFRVPLYILYSLYIIIGWAELGLSRSRGAIAATAIGIGVYFFVIVYDRLCEKKLKAFVAAFFVFLGTIVASIGILLVPKYSFDAIVTNYVAKTDAESLKNVQERLEIYGITYSVENLVDRTDIWAATIRMLDEKPERWIWGMTAQRVSEEPIYDIYGSRPEISFKTVHSGYLEQLFIYGIPGTAILAVLLVIWIITCFKVAFSNKISTKEKMMLAPMATAFVNALVEAFLFPFYAVYPISFYFFMCEGSLEGDMEKKEKSFLKRLIIAILIILFLVATGLVTRHVYLKSKAKFEKIPEIVIKEQSPDDYVRLNNGISADMMSADYWINLREEQGIDVSDELLSVGEIARFNQLNRRMIATTDVAFSLKEIDDVFYYKVAQNLIKDTMFTVKDPDKYILNGEPTDAAYWEKLEANANVDGLTERINVKFGVSVSGTVLKKYPTDDGVFTADENLYYDEMAQSDLLPFMPVAVLHESADEEWYYVITYGYGGWIRKEKIALYESREAWLNSMEPEDFLIVTGKEIRLGTDPYTDELSGMLIPMGTKLPIVSLKDTPEDIHNRISYGNYVAKLPKRNEEGMVEDEYILIPSTEDVNLGYLPYTEENVAKLAFKHLGNVYGWAGDNNGQDCSGYTHEIYACFGYTLPRSARAQSEMESSASYDVSDKSAQEIKGILDDAPIGTLLYFPGHIMLYLGTENGVPYCISSVGNFATAEMENGETKEVNTVIVTDMINTTRADGKSWLESLLRVVTP